jgi:hypothetical protein
MIQRRGMRVSLARRRTGAGAEGIHMAPHVRADREREAFG